MKAAPSSSNADKVKRFWKSIWRLKVPNKVKVFLWRACSNALPTKVNLQRRKVLDNPLCEQCKCRGEDVLHAIWSCENLREGWEQSFAEVRRKFPCVVSLCDLVSIIKEEGKRLEEFAMSVWLIWIRRNKQRLNEPAQPLSKLAQSATALLDEFQQEKQRKKPQSRAGPVRWQPPPVGSMKANFDGAMFGEEKEGGIGVVIRSNEGQVLAALSEKVLMPTSVEILEMLAARRAALFARELGFGKVCFE